MDKPLTLQEAKDNLRGCEESFNQEVVQAIRAGGFKTLLLAAGAGFALGAFPVSLGRLAGLGLRAFQFWTENSDT